MSNRSGQVAMEHNYPLTAINCLKIYAMTTQIKQKWFCQKYNLSITDDGKVYTQNLTELKEEYYQGRLIFRIPKTSIRISRSFIKHNSIKAIKILQQYVPF